MKSKPVYWNIQAEGFTVEGWEVKVHKMDSMIIVLTEWLSLKHLTDLNSQVRAQPLEFETSAESIREANRR